MDDGTVNDYSQGVNSPQQHVHDGTGKALALVAVVFGALAFGGVIVGAILIPDIIEARASEAAAPARATASYAERDARVALDKLQTAQLELNRQGFKVDFNAH
jgi:hypothetical protein